MKKIIKGILRNKYIYIMLLLMNIVVLVFAGITYNNYKYMKTTDSYINSYLNIKDLYTVINSWSIEDNEHVLEMNTFVDGGIRPYTSQYENKMKKNGTNQYGIEDIANYVAFDFPITEVKDNPRFFDGLTYVGDIEDTSRNVEMFLGKPFALQIKYPIIKGRDFIEADFENGSENVYEYWNVLAGYDFMENYVLGDELTLELPGDYNQEIVIQKVRIVGFINKGTKILENLSDGRLIKADNKLVVPLRDDVNNDLLRTIKYSFLSMGSNYIITEKPKEVEHLLLEEAKGDGYKGKDSFIQIKEPTFEYKNYRVKGNNESLKVYVSILTISISILLLSTGIGLLLLVRKNRYHYGVFLLTGARKINILKDLMLEILLILFLADIISILCFAKHMFLLLPLEVIALQNLLVIFIVLITGLLILYRRRVIYFIKFNNNAN